MNEQLPHDNNTNEQQQLANVTPIAKGKTQFAMILDYLRTHTGDWFTAKQIAAAIGIPETSASSASTRGFNTCTDGWEHVERSTHGRPIKYRHDAALTRNTAGGMERTLPVLEILGVMEDGTYVTRLPGTQQMFASRPITGFVTE